MTPDGRRTTDFSPASPQAAMTRMRTKKSFDALLAERYQADIDNHESAMMKLRDHLVR
jgi:hypothetical protein